MLRESPPFDFYCERGLEHKGSEYQGRNTGNAHGNIIELRLREDNLKSFLPYARIRQTLCHELAHNRWEYPWQHDLLYLWWASWF